MGNGKRPRRAPGEPFAGVGEEGRVGGEMFLPGSAKRASRPRPLDDAMAAARSLRPPFRRSSHSVAAGCAEVERGESGEEEREAESANVLGFLVGGRGRSFVRAKSTRSRRSPSDGQD